MQHLFYSGEDHPDQSLPRFSPIKKKAPENSAKNTVQGQEEWKEFRGSLEQVPWVRILFLGMVVAWFSSAFTSAADTLDEMMVAYEDDLPSYTLPTRSQFYNIPLLGRAFRMSYDLGDLIRVNARFCKEYVGCLPWILATPALASSAPVLATPFLKGAMATKAAVLALGPIMKSV